MDTIIAQIDEAQEAPRQEFHIVDEASANWLLRKLANLEAEKRRVQAQAGEIIRSLDSGAARLRHLYEAELQEFARRRLEEKGNRSKTLRLLQGTCAFRTVPGGLKVTDLDAALPHAHAMGCTLTRVEVNSAAYREAAEKALAETGELLPGVEITEGRESFGIRFGKEAAAE